MQKTPDEIKAALECRSGLAMPCVECAYCDSKECAAENAADALDYILRLEYERGVALGILYNLKECTACDHKGCADCRWFDDITKRNMDLRNNWRWRGVQEATK